MPESITAPFGFTLDPIVAVVQQIGAGVAYDKGDVLAMIHTVGNRGIGLNSVIQGAISDSASNVYCVVTKTVAAGEDIPVCIRGRVEATVNSVGTPALALPALYSGAAHSGAPTPKALVSASQSNGGTSNPNVLANLVDARGSVTTTGLYWVMFDGLNGLGSIGSGLTI